MIDTILIDPKDPAQIIAGIDNRSSDFFSYPGWILRDTTGDTIAIHTVELFGFEHQASFGLRINQLDKVIKGQTFVGT